MKKFMQKLFSILIVLASWSPCVFADYRANAVLVGESGVGKTVLLRALINQVAFDVSVGAGDPHTRSVIPQVSITVHFDQKDVEKRIVDDPNAVLNLTFCDTAGEEKYFSLQRATFEDIHFVFLCVPLNVDISASEEKYERYVSRWLDAVHKNNPGCSVILVGTKSDFCDSDGFGISAVYGRTMERLTELSNHETVPFIAVSSTNPALVLERFNEAIKQTFLKSERIIIPYMQDPSKFPLVRKDFVECSSGSKCIGDRTFIRTAGHRAPDGKYYCKVECYDEYRKVPCRGCGCKFLPEAGHSGYHNYDCYVRYNPPSSKSSGRCIVQ